MYLQVSLYKIIDAENKRGEGRDEEKRRLSSSSSSCCLLLLRLCVLVAARLCTDTRPRARMTRTKQTR
jgi:hypothetical protein